MLKLKQKNMPYQMAQSMVNINNLLIGLLIGQHEYRYLSEAGRFFNAYLDKAFDLVLLP